MSTEHAEIDLIAGLDQRLGTTPTIEFAEHQLRQRLEHGLKSVIEGLRIHTQQRNAAIGLPHITIASEDVVNLITELEEPGTLGRLIKYGVDRKLPYPILFLLGGRLIPRGIPAGPDAIEDAAALITYLASARDPVPLELPETLEKKNILTTELLDQAMRLTAFTGKGSIAEQLEDQFALAKLGLVLIPPGKGAPEWGGFALPKVLFKILQGLKFPESSEVLEGWIYQKLSEDHPEYCIDLLRTISQFFIFLDSEAFVHLYSSGRKGEIPLLPFQAFHKAIVSAKDRLMISPGYEAYADQLTKIEQATVFRFHAIISGPLKGAVSATATEALTPSVDDLATTFYEWLYKEAMARGLTTKESVDHAVAFLEQSGLDAGGIIKFCDLLIDVGEMEISEAVKKEAVRLNLVQDKEIERTIKLETLELLREQPWVDAAELNFAELIREGVRVLEFYVVTGTIGPAVGHPDLIKRALAYFKHLERQENGDKSTQRFVFVLPLTNPVGVPGYPKSSFEVGPLYARVGSLLIPLADPDEFDREKVLVTTLLQPPPSEAGDTDASIKATINALNAKIHEHFGAAKRIYGTDIRIFVCVGLDELQWSKREDAWELTAQQPRKLRFPHTTR